MQDAGVASHGAASRASCRTYMPQGSRIDVTPASDGAPKPASDEVHSGLYEPLWDTYRSRLADQQKWDCMAPERGQPVCSLE